MPSPEHEAYRERLLFWFRAHAEEPDVAAQLQRYQDAAAILWELDLAAARPVLAACYAPSPRGGKPWDPVLLLRCLLLMLLAGQPSINDWADDLGASRVLRVLAGLPEEGRPGVGTFYDLLHRLHDGPVRRSCEHQERPSDAERRRSRTPRPLQRTEQPPPPAPPARGRRGKKRRKQEKAAIVQPVAAPAVTERLAAELRAAASQAAPNDLLERLGTLLMEVAVGQSTARGLLGDVAKLSVGGDGSMLRTGASRHGKRTCDHPKTERCDCPRVFDDPDAREGYDCYRNAFYFGHRFYELTASAGGHDLPLALRLDAGNATDFTASLLALDRLFKRAGKLGMAIQHFIADAGHDGEAVYRFSLAHGATPVIPLKAAAPAVHPNRPALTLSPRGVPTCQANVEMAPWGSAGEGKKVFVCPVKAGRLKCCPLAPADDPGWLCRPEQKWGPSVAVDVASNPRLCPPIPRNSPRFEELKNLRTGCERSNSVKKQTFKLEEARHRRASFWLVRLHLIAVLQHARAWVGDGAGRRVADHLLGRTPAPQAQSA